MKMFTRTFLTGLITILPVVATFYLLYWLFRAAETVLGGVFKMVLPDVHYIPGLGVVLSVLIVFMTGLMMRTWIASTFFSWFEKLLLIVPVFKTVYSAFRDFFTFLTRSKDEGLQQVVAVRLGSADMHCIGFITQDKIENLPVAIAGSDTVAVYLPLSYQIGGHMVLVPRSALQPLEMSMEEAMRFTVTAGLSISAVSGNK